MTQQDHDDVKRYLGVLAEDFTSKLQLFAEGLTAQIEALARRQHEQYQELKADIRMLEAAIQRNSQDIQALRTGLAELRAEMTQMEQRLTAQIERIHERLDDHDTAIAELRDGSR
ncbi:MAG: hypothetical protein HY696_00760 [Deltaproteobacteria bacterium]|nr:hypothetical protein [Deltaproteobacteria bacterium]